MRMWQTIKGVFLYKGPRSKRLLKPTKEATIKQLYDLESESVQFLITFPNGKGETQIIVEFEKESLFDLQEHVQKQIKKAFGGE